ncbi:VWA domain-containing protein [Streptomyces sp. NRRL F-5630]|uniref:VWA domain-containing protein n=1 Tax=Streptomyces sp. NRRL F-5630 TaxID=1463864 RepID=UPI003D751CCC
MGILDLLRNAFGRRKAEPTEAEAEGQESPRAPEEGEAASAAPHGETPARDAEPAALTVPAARTSAAETEPRPEPRPEPVPEQRRSTDATLADDLVAAAFDRAQDRPTIPHPAEPAEPETPEVAEAPDGAARTPEAARETEEAEAEAAPATEKPKAEAVPETEKPEADAAPEAEKPEAVRGVAETATEAEVAAPAASVPETKTEAAPAAEPEPAPEPEAAAAPEPEAAAEPTPAARPTPEPAPAPQPEPAAATTPEPEDTPASTPAPETAPEPKATPAPEAAPAPEATPAPDATSAPAPAPEPQAAPTPDATPEPAPAPTADATPEPTPLQATATPTPAVPAARVKRLAPALAPAHKSAGAALRTAGLTGTRARVYLVLDRSGSMRPYYKDGSAQALGEQVLALAAHLDAEAVVRVVFFSTAIDAVGTLALDAYEGVVDELHAGAGRMGRTNYALAIEEVRALHAKEAAGEPGLVVFQTDGPPDVRTAATQALKTAEAEQPELRWQFVSFGETESKNFDYLRRLKAANAGWFAAGPVPKELTDAEVLGGLLADWRPQG